MPTLIDPFSSSKRTTDLTETEEGLLQVAMDAASDVLTTVNSVARNVTADDIEVAFHLSKTLFAPGGLSLAETTLLLLKGGLAFRNLVTSPLELSVPTPDVPTEGWTHWRQTDEGSYEILHADSGQWQAISGTVIDRSPSPAEELISNYSRTTAWSLGSTTVVTQTEIVLAADGAFEQRGVQTATFSDGLGSAYVKSAASGWSSVDEAHANATEPGLTDQWLMLDDGLTLEVTRTDGTIDRLLAYKIATGLFVDGHGYTKTGGTPTISAAGEFKRIAQNSGRASWLSALGDAEDKKRKNDKDKPGHKLTAEDLARDALQRKNPEPPPPA